MKRTDALIEKAKAVIGGHYWCEDCFYTCPQHPDEQREGWVSEPCNCNFSERLEALIVLLETVYGMGMSKGFEIGAKR
jgi:hypothetical protein